VVSVTHTFRLFASLAGLWVAASAAWPLELLGWPKC
jgi:hypothetical protein